MKTTVRSFFAPLRRCATVATLASILLVGCAGTKSGSTTPAAQLGTQPWTLTFSDTPCILQGASGLVTSGGCGEAQKLTMTPAIAQDLGASVQRLQPRREETAGGMMTVLSSGPTTTVMDPTQSDVVLAALWRHLAASASNAREARFTIDAADVTCPAGQVVLTIDSCPGDPNNPVADVCGPKTHTCGPAQANGAACQHNSACTSNRCSAASVCE